MRSGNTIVAFMLIAGGLALLATLYVLLAAGDWRMHFPSSLIMAGLCALPALGLAHLYAIALYSHLDREGHRQ